MTSNCVRRRQNRVRQACDTYREVTALICNNKKEPMDLWHVIPITVYGAEKQGNLPRATEMTENDVTGAQKNTDTIIRCEMQRMSYLWTNTS